MDMALTQNNNHGIYTQEVDPTGARPHSKFCMLSKIGNIAVYYKEEDLSVNVRTLFSVKCLKAWKIQKSNVFNLSLGECEWNVKGSEADKNMLKKTLPVWRQFNLLSSPSVTSVDGVLHVFYYCISTFCTHPI